MIIKQLAYKVTLQAQDFLSGKQKVKQEVADLNDDIVKNNKKSDSSFKLLNRSMGEMGRIGHNSFSLLQTGAARFLGVALTLEGARRMFLGTTEQLVRMGNTAGYLGMSTQSLDGFTKAAEAAGASGASAASNLMRLKNAQLIMQTGLGPPDETSRQLMMLSSATGIDVLGQKNPGDMMLAEARALRQLPRQQSQVMAGNLGIDSDLYQTMMSDDWERNVRQYTQQSNKTPAAVQQAQQIQKAMTDLNSSIENVEVTLLQVFGPDITRGLNSLSDWIKNNKGEITGFFSDASTQAQKLSDAVGGVGNLLKIYAGYKVGGLPGAAAAAGYVITDKSLSETEREAKREGKSVGQYLVEQGQKEKKPFINRESKPDNSIYKDASLDGIWDLLAKPFRSLIPSANASDSTPMIPGVNETSGVRMGSLLESIMMTESGGNPNARSGAGAVGAFQFMKGTAQDYGLTVNDQVDERLDPQKSAIAAEAHISRLLRKYDGNVQNALRAYNWGEGNMDSYLKTGHGIITKSNPTGAMPKETADYSGKVSSYYSRIANDAMAKPSHSSYDNSQTNTTHIDTVNVTSNPQSVDQLTTDLQAQAQRSRVTVSFSGGPS